MNSSLHKQNWPLWVVLAACLLIGALTVADFGESWDEADIVRYSQYSLDAYRDFFHPGALPAFDTNLNLYGPGYFMAANLAAKGMRALLPGVLPVTAWHFVYFVTFLAGALALYGLARRWASPLAALGAMLLFLSQPLIWGHAFINPKDIPFLSCFTATVFCGFAAMDAIRKGGGRGAALLVAAALLLGLAASFRIAGGWAAMIVSLYGVHILRRKAMLPLIGYFVIAILVGYSTWPYLWLAPIAHYVESIRTMAQFPFALSILFAGSLYKADSLPWTYFPTLLGLQLTEPALVLAAAGIVLAIQRWRRRRDEEPLFLFLGWFLIPAAAVIVSGRPLYDNGRQLYFLLPPLFLVAALAFDELFSKLSRPAFQAGVVGLAALPGILLGVRLHPYEYVYYNSLVRGTGGAYRQYEMDYWGTSFKEIATRLNAIAAPGARVLVYGPEQLVEHYARTDLKPEVPTDDASPAYDYAIFLTRANIDERHCKQADTIYSLGRRGAVFSMLRRVPPGVECR
jgi:hypothetical protein